MEEKREKRIRSDFHWARIKDSKFGSIDSYPTGVSERSEDKGTRKPDIGSHDAQVPVIRSTLLDTEDHKDHGGRKADDVTSHNDNSTSSRILSSARQDELHGLTRPMLPLKARQFHLVKNSFLSPSHVIAGHGVQKRKSKEKSIALFTERRVLQLQLQLLEDSSKLKANMHQLVETSSIQHHELVTPEPRKYKRPTATAEEVKWRAKTWQKPAKTDKDKVPTSDDPEGSRGDDLSYGDYSLELAMQLQEFAIQETQNAAHQSSMERRSQLKHQPKLPGPRPEKPVAPMQKIQNDTTMPNNPAGENDQDFVYDTYVRSDGPIRNAPGLNDSTPDADGEEVGLLVIEEEDEEAWEEYGEDAESDKKWDTDDEDENG